MQEFFENFKCCILFAKLPLKSHIKGWRHMLCFTAGNSKLTRKLFPILFHGRLYIVYDIPDLLIRYFIHRSG